MARAVDMSPSIPFAVAICECETLQVSIVRMRYPATVFPSEALAADARRAL